MTWRRDDIQNDGDGYTTVCIHDQRTDIVLMPFHTVINDAATLSEGTAVNDDHIHLTAGHGASVGDLIVIQEGTHFYVGTILTLVTNVATMDSLLDYPFTTAATVEVGDANLNVDGSSTPVHAKAKPLGSIQWDITRIHVQIIDNVVMDSAKFGGIAALTKGVIFRKTNGPSQNVANVKTNGDLSLLASFYEYDAKAPAGSYGFISHHVFSGQEHLGVTLHVDGDINDELEVIIQDDLTDLTTVRMIAIGHVHKIDPIP